MLCAKDSPIPGLSPQRGPGIGTSNRSASRHFSCSVVGGLKGQQALKKPRTLLRRVGPHGPTLERYRSNFSSPFGGDGMEMVVVTSKLRSKASKRSVA